MSQVVLRAVLKLTDHEGWVNERFSSITEAINALVKSAEF